MAFVCPLVERLVLSVAVSCASASQLVFSRPSSPMFYKVGFDELNRLATAKKTVPPDAKSQHTTWFQWRSWYFRWMPARPPEGRGQLFFPLWQPHPQECGCQTRFHRDVRQIWMFLQPATPVRNRRRPLRLLSKPLFIHGTACPAVFSACCTFPACPEFHINCPSVEIGDPAGCLTSP
jgi:hypothetical protein